MVDPGYKLLESTSPIQDPPSENHSPFDGLCNPDCWTTLYQLVESGIEDSENHSPFDGLYNPDCWTTLYQLVEFGIQDSALGIHNSVNRLTVSSLLESILPTGGSPEASQRHLEAKI